MTLNATDAVTQAVEALRKAILAGDGEALDKLSADELSYGHGSGEVQNKSEFIEQLTCGTSGWTEITLSDQTVDVIENVAVVRHIFRGTSRNPPDGIVHKKIHVLTVWIERQGQWKMLARQAQRLPPP